MTNRRTAGPGRVPSARPSSSWAALRTDRRTISFPSRTPAPADITRVQDFFSNPLPDAWVTFVLECGSVAGFGRALLGLRQRDTAANADLPEDALDVIMFLRLTEPNFPTDLLPIEVLPDRQLHCVVVEAAHRSAVVLIDLDRPTVRVEAARFLTDFVYQWRNDLRAMAAVVEEIASLDSTDEIILLRPDEWSTRRLCSQNVIVGLLQTRHNRDANEHDVAIFTTATLTSFAPGAATRWALATVLTEAHQAGGSLAVNFVRRTRDNGKLDLRRIETTGQRIPSTIVHWSAAHGVPLDHKRTRWDHATGEKLLLAATRLPRSLRELLLHTRLSPATACAAVNTGTWPALDVEVVLRWTSDPIRVLTGTVTVADRLRYLSDQQVVRSAMMLSSLHRHLERIDQPSASDDDDTARVLDITITESPPADLAERTLSGVTFRAADGKPLTARWPLLAGRPNPSPVLTVHCLAVEADLLAQVGAHVASHLPAGVTLLVPADGLARAHQLEEFRQAAEKADVVVLVAPNYTTSMDVKVAARLDRARMSRQ